MARLRNGFGYVRVSRVNGRDGDAFISPDVQRERIEAVAKANGIRIVDWFEDYDRSGATNDRPGFQAMLERVEQGDAQLVLVARLSRFARSVSGMHESLQRIATATNGTGGLVTPEIGDTTTPTGKLLLNVLAAIADFELEVARENWQVAQAKAVARGVKIANKAPIGYRFDAGRRLEADAKTGALVTELFRLRADGHSYSDLRRFWHERTGRWLYQQTITALLKNRVYLGEVHYGGLVERGAHPALVDVATFDAAQTTFAPRPARRAGSLLGGLLRCGTCGGKLTAGGRGEYRCQAQSNRGCTAPVSVKREPADAEVDRRFREWAAGLESSYQGSPATSERDAAEAELARAKADLAALLRLDLSVVDEAEVQAAAAERQAAVDAAEAALAAAHVDEHQALRFANAVDVYDTSDLAGKRRLIAAAIETAVVERPSVAGARVAFCDRATIMFR